MILVANVRKRYVGRKDGKKKKKRKEKRQTFGELREKRNNISVYLDGIIIGDPNGRSIPPSPVYTTLEAEPNRTAPLQ